MARPKKIIHFKLTAYKNISGSTSFRVTGTKPDGVRIRRNFNEKSEALQLVADLEQEVVGLPETRRALRTTLTASELADAEAALHQVGTGNLSIIVSHYRNLNKRALDKGGTLDEAIAFFERQYRPETKECSIMSASEEFIRKRVSISKATKRNYEGSLQLLLTPDPNKPVNAFTVADIEGIISGYSNLSTRKTHCRIFSVFFNWAVRHHYCNEDPCKRLDKFPKERTLISVLSFDEVRRLLYAAISHQEGVAAATTAIGIFAGLRPSEIADLKPAHIGKHKIQVSGGKLRRKLNRSVPIPPVLAAWLEAYPFVGLPSGWDYKMKALKRAVNATNWVQDIIRHTSISFQTERDKNEALTAYNCGTSVQMMNLHYRNTIEDAEVVEAFWNLSPNALLVNQPESILPSGSKTAWPKNAELKKLIWSKPLIHAAADIGVSNVALKKHCVKLGIDLPPHGYWLRGSLVAGGR